MGSGLRRRSGAVSFLAVELEFGSVTQSKTELFLKLGSSSVGSLAQLGSLLQLYVCNIPCIGTLQVNNESISFSFETVIWA